MRFADLVAPLSPEQFLADYWGKRPVHLPAQPGVTRPALVDWDRLNALLRQRAHWDADHLKLVMNSRAVALDHYLDVVPAFGSERRLANAAKVEALLAMGASLVANEVQDAAPEVRDLTDELGRMFGARAWGNLYASFQGVQAFASHFDTHEVFAIHGAGEKRWRLYTNRADNPTDIPDGDGAQAALDAAKGPVTMDVVLRPGDVLYIPRGWFHDAIASAEASLHLTVGVLPPTGELVFDLLKAAAMQDSAFRAYLPDARVDAGAPLERHLADLMQRLTAIAATPVFRDGVAVAQARVVDPGYATRLPQRPRLAFFARTEERFEMAASPRGDVLRVRGGDVPLGRLREIAEFALERPAFSDHELVARFLHHPRTDVFTVIATLERAGLVRRYHPERG